ncbi:hypothetical protein LZ31DRAFT_579971 [Colletotrichum somersetense]|nr:hypothetical protein LZ31DRAFT_579971 [Colletotrichum somersetense]
MSVHTQQIGIPGLVTTPPIPSPRLAKADGESKMSSLSIEKHRTGWGRADGWMDGWMDGWTRPKRYLLFFLPSSLPSLPSTYSPTLACAFQGSIAARKQLGRCHSFTHSFIPSIANVSIIIITYSILYRTLIVLFPVLQYIWQPLSSLIRNRRFRLSVIWTVVQHNATQPTFKTRTLHIRNLGRCSVYSRSPAAVSRPGDDETKPSHPYVHPSAPQPKLSSSS